MRIERLTIQGSQLRLPAVIISPPNPRGGAVIAHGYGGSKEEQLGLAWRVAEAGLAACAIDLRGHGQNPLPLDGDVKEDMESAIRHCRRYGKVVAIGHSIGGRLALHSSADYAIGISPPLDPAYCAKTQGQLEKFRSYRVRPGDPGVVFGVLAGMPSWKGRGVKGMIVYGTRDVPEITRACEEIEPHEAAVVRVENALHGDTYLLEATFDAISKQLSGWFCGEERAVGGADEAASAEAAAPNDAGA